MSTYLDQARDALETARTDLRDKLGAVEKAETGEARDAAYAEFETVEQRVKDAEAEVKRAERIAEASRTLPAPVLEERPAEERKAGNATARGELREESVYRPDKGDVSYFKDLMLAYQGDSQARERQARNRAQVFNERAEYRDMDSSSTSGGDFVPPGYLADLYIVPQRAGRPFADAVPKAPLPDVGLAFDIPKLTSGGSVAVRADNATVSETDGVTDTVTHRVFEYAGQVDMGRIVMMRSQPGLDMVIMRDLVRSYDVALDTALIAGTGSTTEHLGIRAVSGINTVTYTDASPTAAETHPKIYNAISDIDTNRLNGMSATHIVMHGRRSTFLASQLSSTFPLYQLGSYNQAAGAQSNGFTLNIAGLPVIKDNNIATTRGTGTNEDEIYVVVMDDLLLMEGPLYNRVFEDVGSGHGTVRFQIFAHSMFISGRYPKGIAKISGTGLAAPSF